MEFAALEQRILHGYRTMFPAFWPSQNAPVCAEEQKAFYDFMKNLYQMLFDDPALLVPALHPDDAFPSRYKKGYGKPALQAQVLKIENAVEGLLKNMFRMGGGAQVKWSRRQQKILALAGLDPAAALPPAWVWMATRPNADPVAFAYCLFDENHRYTADLYAPLLGEAPFRRLEKWMTDHGYRAYDTYNTQWPDYQLTLCYANPAWGDERPRGGNAYKIKHTGICAQFDAYVDEPVSLGLCIPSGMKPYLAHFDQMPPKVQAFVMERTKKCDGCRYCVQTDKTGRRPLACIPIRYRDETYRLCPYFPGYRYCWHRIDDGLVGNLTALLDFMDGFAGKLAAK